MMQGIIGAINTMGNNLSIYDNLIAAHNPIVYFPLNSSSFVSGLNCYKSHYALGTDLSNLNSMTHTGQALVNGSNYAFTFEDNPGASFVIYRDMLSKLNMYQNKSIEFWYKHGTRIDNHLIMDGLLWNINSSQFNVVQNWTPLNAAYNNKIALGRKENESWSSAVNNTLLTVGNIYHVVIQWDTTTAFFYINGVADGSSPFITISKPQGYIHVGYTAYTKLLSNTPFSNLAFYDRLLTPQEISDHYNTGVIV